MGRRDLPKEAVDERAETSPAAEILEGEGLSMGKEVKIGLGVIVVLLVLFGGVLYYRLSGPPSEAATAAEQEPAEPAGEATVASEPASEASTPTVVTATAGADSGRSKISVSDMSQWTQVPAGSRASSSSSEGRIPSPSYMPSVGAANRSAGSAQDPFHRQTVQVQVDSGESSGAASGQTTQFPAAMAYADAYPSASPADQAGVAEAGAASQNPLRGLSAGATAGTSSIPSAPISQGSYGYAASNSSLQAAADQGMTPPQPIPGYGASSRPTYRSAQESPAYGSRFRTPSTRTSLGNPWAANEAGTTADASASYGGSSYGARASSGASSLLGDTSSVGSSQVMNNSGKYEIRGNDNYWMISKNLYGTGSFFKALAEHNRKKFPDPDRLKAGEVIETPSLEELRKKYPDLCPKAEHCDTGRGNISPVSTQTRHGGRVYVVQEGDTLFDIARYELGKAARWAEIYELNRESIGTDFDHLSPGMQLLLPHGQSPGKVTQRSNDLFQR